jgi:C-terminal processing protease CtpA/Prc
MHELSDCTRLIVDLRGNTGGGIGGLRFVEAKWGVSENNRRAKFYSITKRGRHRLGEQQESWERLVRAMELALGTKVAAR